MVVEGGLVDLCPDEDEECAQHGQRACPEEVPAKEEEDDGKEDHQPPQRHGKPSADGHLLGHLVALANDSRLAMSARLGVFGQWFSALRTFHEVILNTKRDLIKEGKDRFRSSCWRWVGIEGQARIELSG